MWLYETNFPSINFCYYVTFLPGKLPFLLKIGNRLFEEKKCCHDELNMLLKQCLKQCNVSLNNEIFTIL